MSESVSLPALGESVTEGTITRWLKKVGDHVEVDEPLLEVSTDKVDTEIPSPVSGTVESILVQEDQTVEVGTPLATIDDGVGPVSQGDEALPVSHEVPPPAPTRDGAPLPEESNSSEEGTQAISPSTDDVQADSVEPPTYPSKPPFDPVVVPFTSARENDSSSGTEPVAAPDDATPPAADQRAGGKVEYVTPLVRKLAHEKGVDLSTLVGTGVGGRIRKHDILAAQPVAEASNEQTKLSASPLRGTTEAMSRLRRVVAERAVLSLQTSAQLTTVVEADVTRVAELRNRIKEIFHTSTGTKLTFLPFFALAATEALQAYPVINSTIEGDSIVYPDHENLSIAVDTTRGLLTPVVRDAGALNIAELALRIADLAERTRANQLKPDELAGGTFTLTNTGSRGAVFDTPVVFLPQVAILGTGIVTKKPVVLSADGVDSIGIRSTVYLSLSYDHRVIDGADASRFLVAIKSRLEEGQFENVLGI